MKMDMRALQTTLCFVLLARKAKSLLIAEGRGHVNHDSDKVTDFPPVSRMTFTNIKETKVVSK